MNKNQQKKAQKKARKKSKENKEYVNQQLKKITGKKVKAPEIKEDKIVENQEAVMVKGINPKKLDRVINEIREKEEVTEKEIEEICKKHGVNPEKQLNVPAPALGLENTKKKWAPWKAKDFLEKIKSRKKEIGGFTESGEYTYINPEISKKKKRMIKNHERIHNTIRKLEKEGKIQRNIKPEVEEALTSYLTSLKRVKEGEEKENVIKELKKREGRLQGDANRIGMKIARTMLKDYKPQEAQETFRKILEGKPQGLDYRFETMIENKELTKKGRTPVKRTEQKKENKGILGKIKNFLGR